jgi:hypothetical protein
MVVFYIVLVSDFLGGLLVLIETTAGENESNGQVTQGTVTSLLACCNALLLLLALLRGALHPYSKSNALQLRRYL